MPMASGITTPLITKDLPIDYPSGHLNCAPKMVEFPLPQRVGAPCKPWLQAVFGA
jgi:hypothetical protein